MNMNIREKQSKEAQRRMIALGVPNEVINRFVAFGTKFFAGKTGSEYKPISSRPLHKKWECAFDRISEFEAQHNALVYLVIRSESLVGIMDSYLFVSASEDEWGQDCDLLSRDEPCPHVYVYNVTSPKCSQFGYIPIKKTDGGGLYRTA